MTPAKRYFLEFSGAMTLYVLTIFLMRPLIARIDGDSPLVWIAALLPMIPVGLIVLAIVRFFRRQDELQQRVLGEAHLIAGMITIFGTFAYGFLEIYADAPDFPLILVLPAFWFLLIPITPLVKRRYR